MDVKVAEFLRGNALTQQCLQRTQLRQHVGRLRKQINADAQRLQFVNDLENSNIMPGLV
jgi:hypothetical protein